MIHDVCSAVGVESNSEVQAKIEANILNFEKKYCEIKDNNEVNKNTGGKTNSNSATNNAHKDEDLEYLKGNKIEHRGKYEIIPN